MNNNSNSNSMVLEPSQIQTGTVVAIYEGIPSDMYNLRGSTFVVKAIQLPFVAIEWPKLGMSWLIDTRETKLVELSKEMVEVLRGEVGEVKV